MFCVNISASITPHPPFTFPILLPFLIASYHNFDSQTVRCKRWDCLRKSLSSFQKLKTIQSPESQEQKAKEMFITNKGISQCFLSISFEHTQNYIFSNWHNHITKRRRTRRQCRRRNELNRHESLKAMKLNISR